jgi:hypothetical protein
MSTWSSIFVKSAALLNDQDRAVYTDTILLPYLNIAINELQEIFELNNIPVTNEDSTTIAVPAGTSAIGYLTTPALPADLIEIQELFESPTGQEAWIPVTKREFITAAIVGNTPLTIFGVWAWLDQQIRVRPAVNAIDIKLNYIKYLFTEITIGLIGTDNAIRNTDTFFQYRTAALAAEFIEENIERADKLNGYGALGLERSLGISVKGKQSIAVRRRPFRAGLKRRGVL